MSSLKLLTLAGLIAGVGLIGTAQAQPIPPRDAEIRRDQMNHRRIEDERSIEAHRHWDNRHHRYIYDPGYYAPPPPPPVIYAAPPPPVYVAPQPAYIVPVQPSSGLNLNLHLR